MAGEIEAKSSKPERAKIEAYFASALAIARQQQAKSWELRASRALHASGATRASRSKHAKTFGAKRRVCVRLAEDL
jgi:hypothetical protein